MVEMVETDVVRAITMALEKMEKAYCKLSRLNYFSVDDTVKKPLLQNKYLERPFAYEFYHQLRKIIETHEVSFGGPIIQAEVDKRYQHCFEDGKVPDFIIHVPDSYQINANLAVIEFKLATNLNDIKNDLRKLREFKKNEHLKYKHAIEVIIGDKRSVLTVKDFIRNLSQLQGEEITIIIFNTDNWKIAFSGSLMFAGNE
jgi:hypothetical protein